MPQIAGVYLPFNAGGGGQPTSRTRRALETLIRRGGGGGEGDFHAMLQEKTGRGGYALIGIILSMHCEPFIKLD